MRILSLVSALLLTLPAHPGTPNARNTAPSSSVQAATLVQQSLSALNGGQSLNDVTISATANSIAGSDNETGTASIMAVAAGASSVVLNLTSGQHVEIVNSSAAPPAGTWYGPDGTPHSMAFHNLLTGPSWFFPSFALAGSSSASGALITYVGHETHNGQAVEHISLAQPAPASSSQGDSYYTHLTQLDFFLDSSTFLPAALDFNIHPDDNELLDIPVEIRFSVYTTVNGAQIPFHVQKFINDNLALDLQFQAASINTGISLAQITAQ